jgi:hypothetical protein
MLDQALMLKPGQAPGWRLAEQNRVKSFRSIFRVLARSYLRWLLRFTH